MNKSQLEAHKKKLEVLSKNKTNEYHNQLLVIELINLLKDESFFKFLTQAFTKGVSIVISSGVFFGVCYLKIRGIYR